jgi:tetratricopeptide (TPR) repeat protein
MGHLGQAYSLRGLGMLEAAVESYTKVINLDPSSESRALMKRGLLFLQLKQNEEGLRDFNQLIEKTEEQEEGYLNISLSKAYYYKAKTLKKLNNMNDAVIYFEQVLRLNEDNFLSGSSLYEIAKIKILQKDFYEAYYNLQRTT